MTTNGGPHNAGDPLEKDFHQHLGNNTESGEALQRIRTAGSISISPELFEKLYLSPQNKVAGDLRKTFGNPTPLALIGFLLALFPLSMTLMEWRGASNLGVATLGTFWFAGGLLMILGGLGEWILGNTFPFVVFSSFGGFWLIYATTLTPYFGVIEAFATDPNMPASGLASVGFNASFGFFTLTMGLLCFLYMICALRTNMIFVGIFLSLVVAFGCLSGVFWQGALGNADLAHTLQITAGAFTFITCCLGWYLFFGIMLASVDFPLALPVGDLSGMIKGASQKTKTHEEV